MTTGLFDSTGKELTEQEAKEQLAASSLVRVNIEFTDENKVRVTTVGLDFDKTIAAVITDVRIMAPGEL